MRPWTKIVIGLTGGIGAGKSEVARILADHGCVVCNSDELGRRAFEDSTIRANVVKWWGSGVLNAQGQVDRKAIASIVFANPGERRRLEGLTHPWIEARRRELFAAAPANAPALVIDAPLLLEAGIDCECDVVVFVDAPESVRLARVRTSRAWDEAELRRREAVQLPLDEKRRRAHYVVVNDGDRNRLSETVGSLLDEIVRSFRASK